jgi:hypothetical protein
VELEAQDKEFVLQVAGQGLKKLSTIPQEFDIKPRVTLVGKIFLLHRSALGVPTNWHTFLVSSGSR